MKKYSDDIKRKMLKEISSGKMGTDKQKERMIKEFPDKAYDPDQLFRQRKSDDSESRMAQKIEDVVEQEKTHPDKQKGDRFKELRKYLGSMNLKK